MFLSSDQLSGLSHIIKFLAEPCDTQQARLKLGELLLRLLRADYYGSYEWDGVGGKYGSGRALNMADGHVAMYEQYYQYRDPITHLLRSCKRPARVTDILPQAELEKTEFFNDFLSRDRLFWGVNLHILSNESSAIDIRIWRSRRAENFEDIDLALLSLIAPALSVALPHYRDSILKSPEESLASSTPHLRKLTPRETEIVTLVAQGLQDKEIARRLHISYYTVRSHMDNVFEKLDLSNRLQLAAMLRGPQGIIGSTY